MEDINNIVLAVKKLFIANDNYDDIVSYYEDIMHSSRRVEGSLLLQLVEAILNYPKDPRTISKYTNRYQKILFAHQKIIADILKLNNSVKTDPKSKSNCDNNIKAIINNNEELFNQDSTIQTTKCKFANKSVVKTINSKETLCNPNALEKIVWPINVGIRRLNNTSCYLNCLLQVLLTIKEFVEIIIDDSFVCLNKRNSCEKFLCSLSQTIKDCEKIKSKSLVPLLYDRFKRCCKRFDALQQQDIHEFFVCLFELIDKDYEDLNKHKGFEGELNPLTIFFTGAFQIVSTCQNCNRTSIQMETFKTLTLPFDDGILILQDSLRSFFAPTEVDYKCSEDGKYECDGKKFSRQYFLYDGPKKLLLSLNRFNLVKKFSEHIFYGEEIDLGEFLCNKKTSFYNLTAVITHHGSTHFSGHYTSACKRGDEYLNFDDEKITKIQKDDFLS